ncbi:RloB family protein [Pedobacter sp. R20-19]|uniref:RloB family protein n=1 Tax=Pedobacter sp. R20-19 TaxID=1270196 RepID=UPI000493375F|nr:RloB family protein [Pedobacter sp. R20-19]
MLTRTRLYSRVAPAKDAKLFLIFCEGSSTEPRYFKYFNGINSQIRIEPVEADDQQDNTPTGLLAAAQIALIASEENPAPQYQLVDGDEVWFAIDTDQWGDKIDKLREGASKYGWNVAQSNPCFEVWLYYHTNSAAPNFDGHEQSMEWKNQLNTILPGGFDCRKHPILIQSAILNTKSSHININTPSTTEIYILAERFLPLVEKEINRALLLI